PVEAGGLGFDYKWDMGWMHDTLDFLQTAPPYRTANYHKLTFSMLYFSNERYLLPFSHDECVHGKATILQKMSGGYDGKFPQARTLYLYMMLHPGKKLNFMGSEFGQLREWDEKREQDWMLRRFPIHDAFYHYMCTLNHLYLSHPALYAADYDGGFRWLDCHQEERCLYAVERRAGNERLIGILNFSDRQQADYVLDIGSAKRLSVLLCSDWQRFGGTTPEASEAVRLEDTALHVTLEPFSGLLLQAD
ncbi:MAG: alpha amylase C-terminal domain-containing protein, partial [Hominenteromicrobium sp.]